jgi:hypothetical protein
LDGVDECDDLIDPLFAEILCAPTDRQEETMSLLPRSRRNIDKAVILTKGLVKRLVITYKS